MRETFEFAAAGCPDPSDRIRLAEVEFPTFRKRAAIIAAKTA